MKYLMDYIQDKQTALLDKMGAFFAFGNKQFDEQKKEGVEYVSMKMGLICPKSNAKELHEGLRKIAKEGMAADLAENGKSGIIRRELSNHEYCYTYDISDTVDAVSEYGITEEEVQAEAAGYLKAHYEWEEKQQAKEDVA